MASTYSPNLRIELIGTGDQAGTWGTTTDNTDAYLLESAIAGYQAVPIAPTSNNQVLTYINGASTTPSVNQSVYAVLKLTASAVAADFNLFAPPASKMYIINNQSGYQATVYNSSVIGNTTAAGTGVAIPSGATVAIYSDGTNFFDQTNYAINNFSIGGNALVNGTTQLVGALSGTTATFSGAISAVSPAFTGTPTVPTAGAGTNSMQAASTAFVQAVAGSVNSVLTGALLMWPTASAPSGYLLCNGSAVSRTTYAALFAVVGTTFGTGDGSTTFNLPNYADRMPIGAGTIAASIGASGGSATTTLSTSNLPSHSHSATSTVTDPGHLHYSLSGGFFGGGSTGGTGPNSNAVNNPTTASAVTGISVATSIGNTGSGTAVTTISPYLGINFIIKT